MGDRYRSKKRLSKEFTKVSTEATEMGKPKGEPSPLLLRDRKIKRERWLLTRKTWRYMADAGRKLIPEGAHNRQEDVPKIEAYFQEVCQREPKFLLWRKSSYPGALSLRSHGRRTRPRKKGGSCKEKANSADEAEEIKKSEMNPCGGGLYLTPTTQGRFDLRKLSEMQKESEDELLQELENLLQSKTGDASKKLNHQELFDKLQKYLQDVQNIQKQTMLKHRSDVIPDPPQRELLDILRRHYSKSTNREAVISNLLTDRKLLEKLYFDLRKTRGFRGAGTAYLPEWRSGFKRNPGELPLQKSSTISFHGDTNLSPTETTPVIEIQEIIKITKSIQTQKIHPDMMRAIEEKLRKPEVEEPAKPQLKEPPKGARRRSSVDHDDVSPSVGDTIKRYLKMARKKSIDTDKKDRFKTINYDENLRNIKPKGEVSTIANDEGLSKGSQAGESWIGALKDLKMEDHWVVKDDTKEVTTVLEPIGSSSRSSSESLASPPSSQQKPGKMSSGQSFLSNLLHGLQHTDKSTVLPTAMQKSKSSTSVGRNLVSKKIWRGRSKSQSRLSTTQPCSWTPQGNCVWSNITGKQVTLTGTTILQLSEIERRILQKVALAKLQALNLGCSIQIPSETVGSAIETKTKRRPHLLKRKAITTSFFDTNRGKDKETINPGGMVFGISLGQCIENERLSRNTSSNISFKSKDSTFPDDSELELRRKSHHGSRTSFSSLIEPRTQDESAGSTESLGSSVPGLLDAISVGSTADITMSTAEIEPSVPNIVSCCLRHIENHGLHTLGIFRVSSSKKRVRQLREDFDSGKEIRLDECCPHDVATLLKEYFRDLPEPLLCRDLYQPFIQTQKLRNRKLQFEALQHLIQLLPVPNRDTLWSLLNFLSLIAANSDDHNDKYERKNTRLVVRYVNWTIFLPVGDLRKRMIIYAVIGMEAEVLLQMQRTDDLCHCSTIRERFQDFLTAGEFVQGNKMDSNNLATLFAPNVLHNMSPNSVSKESLSAQSCEERIDVINVVRSMIDHNRNLFVVSAELLDEVYIHMMDTHPEALDQLLRKRETAEDALDDPDSEEVLEEIGTGSESSSLPQTPKTFAESTEEKEERKKYSREQFLHEKAFDGFEFESRTRLREKEKSRTESEKKVKSDCKSSAESQSQQSERKPEDEDRSSSVFLDNSNGVIKASLTIPTSSFVLNLDDSDIPYIEDNTNNITEGSKHQMTIGMVRNKATGNYGSGRYRSTNGSDSSQVSIPVASSLSYFQGATGSDSAVGSSATYSSPPRNTATSSVCSSSDKEYLSSPPSWGSSPPLSPDSQTSILDDLSDDPPVSTIGRLSITTKSVTDPTNSPPDKEDVESEIVKVSLKPQKKVEKVEKAKPKEIAKNSESRKSHSENEKKQEGSKSVTKDLYQRVHSLVGGSSNQLVPETLPKSASSSQLSKKLETEPESTEWSRKVTTSISNIGGAVMRSKTADIERMLKIKQDVKKSKAKTESKSSVKSESDKKYSKRRYTDTRHQTKAIPDLSEKSGITQSQKQQSIWKRREIISSPPKGGEDS